jgi:signal peptidase I
VLSPVKIPDSTPIIKFMKRLIEVITENRFRMRKRTVAISAFLVASAVLAGFCPYRVGIVCGESMTPTMQSHQPFVIDRSYYAAHVPERGEVAVFHHGGITLIKRVVGVPGDRIWMLKYAGTPSYKQILAPNELAPRMKALAARPYLGKILQVRVPAGCYYMVGDGGPKSVDSRDFGPIPMQQFVGRVISEPCSTPVNVCRVPTLSHSLVAHR